METLNYLNTSEEVKQSTQSLLEEWNSILSKIEEDSWTESALYQNAYKEYLGLKEKINESIKSESEITRSELGDLRGEFSKLNIDHDENKDEDISHYVDQIHNKKYMVSFFQEKLIEKINEYNSENKEYQSSIITEELKSRLGKTDSEYTLLELKKELVNKNVSKKFIEDIIGYVHSIRMHNVEYEKALYKLAYKKTNIYWEKMNDLFFKVIKENEISFDGRVKPITSIDDLNEEELILLSNKLRRESTPQRIELYRTLTSKLHLLKKSISIKDNEIKLSKQVLELHLTKVGIDKEKIKSILDNISTMSEIEFKEIIENDNLAYWGNLTYHYKKIIQLKLEKEKISLQEQSEDLSQRAESIDFSTIIEKYKKDILGLGESILKYGEWENVENIEWFKHKNN